MIKILYDKNFSTLFITEPNHLKVRCLICLNLLFQITSSIYTYFIAKVTELLDTIFFVLRKKYNQVTFLHVYHHFLMFWSPWFVVKYEPSISTVFLGTLNSFVHIIMYSYYGLSAFPSMSKYLWWKKYITRMQLVCQFVIFIYIRIFLL